MQVQLLMFVQYTVVKLVKWNYKMLSTQWRKGSFDTELAFKLLWHVFAYKLQRWFNVKYVIIFQFNFFQ